MMFAYNSKYIWIHNNPFVCIPIYIARNKYATMIIYNQSCGHSFPRIDDAILNIRFDQHSCAIIDEYISYKSGPNSDSPASLSQCESKQQCVNYLHQMGCENDIINFVLHTNPYDHFSLCRLFLKCRGEYDELPEDFAETNSPGQFFFLCFSGSDKVHPYCYFSRIYIYYNFLVYIPLFI